MVMQMVRVAVLSSCMVMGAVWPVRADVPGTVGWHEQLNTKLITVGACSTGQFPSVCGNSGQDGLLSWSGGVYDSIRHRLLVWGGGHFAYGGNEFYAYNLTANPITVTRVNNPDSRPSSCTPGTPNGRAASRHSYDGIEYQPFNDTMFVYEGSLDCSTGADANDTWTYAFATDTWTQRTPSGASTTSPTDNDFAMMSAYDAPTHQTLMHNRRTLFTYHHTDNKYTAISDTAGVDNGLSMTMSVDPVRRLAIVLGDDSTAGGFRVYSYDLTNLKSDGTISSQANRVTRYSGANPGLGQSPGCDYDPRSTLTVCWSNTNRNTVYFFNPSTNGWTSTTYSGGPGPPLLDEDRGVYGRMRYSPYLDAFVVMNSVENNLFVLRINARLTSDQDFSARCAASGVIVCEGFDTSTPFQARASSFTSGTSPATGGSFANQVRDTNVKASGSSSFKFVIPGNTSQNMAGDYRNVWPSTFGEGQTYYVQFRWRADTTFITTSWNTLTGATSPKVSILHYAQASCSDVEWTTGTNLFDIKIPTTNTRCGSDNVVTNGGVPPYEWQQGNFRCMYSETLPYGGNQDCLYLPANEWITWDLKMTIGTWGTASTLLEAWISTETQPYRQKFVHMPNWTISNTSPVFPGFNTITFTPYMTGKNDTVAHTTANVWYDELIVSSQPIASPIPSSTSTSSDTTPPTAPTNVFISRNMKQEDSPWR